MHHNAAIFIKVDGSSVGARDLAWRGGCFRYRRRLRRIKRGLALFAEKWPKVGRICLNESVKFGKLPHMVKERRLVLGAQVRALQFLLQRFYGLGNGWLLAGVPARPGDC